MSNVLGITHSLGEQPWTWRSSATDGRDGAFQPDDLVTQILLARGCPRDSVEQFRNPKLRAFMPDPSVFRDMDVAATRIADAVEAGQAITVFGDYDVDGATSAALLIRLLRDLGCTAGYYIPDRLMEGYGPSGKALVALGEAGSDLVITVDCGAQAFEALDMAKEAKVEVIVVDHHQCLATLPAALAMVNPNRLDESDEGAAQGHLAAVGVAFLLGAALLRELRGRGFFEGKSEPSLMPLLDLVALGTVADVARLVGLNRAFVAQGVKVMRERRNIGMAALMDAARLSRPVEARDLGFALGPRINAGGRVGKSDLGVRLLITEDPDEARDIAAQLDRLNEERRAIEAQVQDEAALAAEGQSNAKVIVVAGHGWHPGVIGIVAGRLKEKFGRPAVVIALDEHGVGKGSGRSISGVDLGAATLAAKEADLIVAGGGHAMAAGLTIEEGKLTDFTAFLQDRIGKDVEAAMGARSLVLDAVLAPRGVNPDYVTAIEEGGPYGMGWPAPRIATGPVRIVKCDIVGNGHVRAIFSGDDGHRIKGIAFGAAETPMGQTLLHAPRDRKLWIAGRAKIDDWGPTPAAELLLEDAAWAD